MLVDEPLVEEQDVQYSLTIDYIRGDLRDRIQVVDSTPPVPEFVKTGEWVFERYMDEDGVTYVEVRADYVVARRLELVGDAEEHGPAADDSPREEAT